MLPSGNNVSPFADFIDVCAFFRRNRQDLCKITFCASIADAATNLFIFDDIDFIDRQHNRTTNIDAVLFSTMSSSVHCAINHKHHHFYITQRTGFAARFINRLIGAFLQYANLGYQQR